MSEEKETKTESSAGNLLTPEVLKKFGLEEYSPEEAAAIAKVLAKAMVAAESEGEKQPEQTESVTEAPAIEESAETEAAEIQETAPEDGVQSESDAVAPEGEVQAEPADEAAQTETAEEAQEPESGEQTEQAADAEATESEEKSEPAAEDSQSEEQNGADAPESKDKNETAAEEKKTEPAAKKSRSLLKRINSTLRPSGDKKSAIPIVIAELIALIAVIMVIANYFNVNPDDPVRYAQKQAADNVTCADGALIYNDVRAEVPTEGNLKYSISYTWSKDDKDYPSVPHAALVSYMDAPENGSTMYEISLYRDSHTPGKEIPSGKTQSNWFSGWTTEKTYEVYKFPHDTGKVSGFCISNLHASHVVDDYRTYTFYFAVPENNGMSVYALEGICYDPEKRDEFHEIIKDSIASLRYENKET